jgi:hypothetical protein
VLTDYIILVYDNRKVLALEFRRSAREWLDVFLLLKWLGFGKYLGDFSLVEILQ